jgi:hypothetical protein
MVDKLKKRPKLPDSFFEGNWEPEEDNSEDEETDFKKVRAKPGPKPERLKIKGNWQAALKKSLAKKKPLEGWPK